MVSQVSRFEYMHLIVTTGIKDKTIFEQTQLLVRTEKQQSRRKCKYFKIRSHFHMMRQPHPLKKKSRWSELCSFSVPTIEKIILMAKPHHFLHDNWQFKYNKTM
jgi:hypothetical protein